MEKRIIASHACDIIPLFSKRLHGGESLVNVNGLQLAYETFGSPKDPAILLIMGLAMQSVHWDERFCRQLAAKGYYVIRFDNRDIGHSSFLNHLRTPSLWELFSYRYLFKKSGVQYTLNDMAADAFGLLNVLGVKHVHLVGASMGGMIAQCMTIKAPHRVLSLANIMSSSGNLDIVRPKLKLLRHCTRPIPLEEERYKTKALKIWRVLSGNHYLEDEKRITNTLMEARTRGHNHAGILRQLAAVLSAPERRPKLLQIHAPTLVIHGSDDPVIPVKCADELSSFIPGSKKVIIDGMGHTLPEALWPTFIAEIEENIQKAPSSPHSDF
ncbi:alpha/beta fold hydrolase [Aestuariibacter sp. AA17]|uniref:Alpha/beta fold hydrolase n=1 Tax=Fluctibacter corallii TaxID=2984329 RepID=A0ABT3A4E1_9ALTE|nr:alpha/beta hydrolase [Aestuariibacter sp. AA17]MCV2883468.1 alpha/beta fold hydrolase [Aestuariibacter sp. AA17]